MKRVKLFLVFVIVVYGLMLLDKVIKICEVFLNLVEVVLLMSI